MTGSELSAAVAFGVRDTPETTYSAREKFLYLQDAVKALASELARRKSSLLAAHTNLPVGPEGAPLPGDWLGLISARVGGRSAPLPLKNRHEFPLSGWGYLGCFLEEGRLHLFPTPTTPEDVDLIYAAKPAFMQVKLPADEDAARTALEVELPFGGRFDLPLIEFVKMRCLNRNEYDTKLELGLYRMLLSQANDVEAMDTAPPRAR